MSNANEETLDFVWQPPTIKSKIFSQTTILGTISVLLVFVAWGLLVHFEIYRFTLFPSPAEVLEEGIIWVGSHVFWR